MAKGLQHDIIVVTRQFKAAPARVFAAWEDTRALERWSSPGDDTWTGTVKEHAFRADGLKIVTFGPRGEPPYTERTRYIEIVPNERIICAETMLHEGQMISASLMSMLFTPAGRGTDFRVTDQITLIDNADSPEARRGGWGEVMVKLEAELAA